MQDYINLAFVLIISALFIACNDEKSTETKVLELGEMEAYIDNNVWYSDALKFVKGSIYARQNNAVGGSTIVIHIGKPNVGIWKASCRYTLGHTTEEIRWLDDNGTCEITKVTNREIHGKFNFIGTNNKEDDRIVEGKFKVDLLSE